MKKNNKAIGENKSREKKETKILTIAFWSLLWF